MGKRKCWLSFIRSLFVSEPKPKAEKKSKCSWRWLFGGKRSKQYQTIRAPVRTLSGAREVQRKHAVAVAIATAAAAEAAVAAARAAAEVVQLTGVPRSYHEHRRRIRCLAAIKIQAAYRGHLARKALKALKGLVRLQALVRGRIVRRRVITILKCAPPVTNAKSQVHESRILGVDLSSKDSENEHFLCSKVEYKSKENKLKCSSKRHWDYSLFSKEDLDDMWLRKQDASTKRDRMKKYSYSHRERRDDQIERRWGSNLDSSRRRALLNLKSKIQSNACASGVSEAMGFKLRRATSHDLADEINSSKYVRPRRSFGDECSLPNSPSFPTYMAPTESAMAKARSMSTPRQRGLLLDPNYADYGSPYKLGISSWSSFNGEVTSFNGRIA